jgi:hypothetical protein
MRIAQRIAKAFERLEPWDLRVGDIWLHPKQVEELRGEPVYDPIAHRCLRDEFIKIKGAPFVGTIYGARVFASEIVPENHIAIAPAGLEAILTDKSACMPF